jgi:hypothetical protein
MTRFTLPCTATYTIAALGRLVASIAILLAGTEAVLTLRK